MNTPLDVRSSGAENIANTSQRIPVPAVGKLRCNNLGMEMRFREKPYQKDQKYGSFAPLCALPRPRNRRL
jgi:hypothetical protein